MVSLVNREENLYADLCDEIRLFYDIRRIPELLEVTEEGDCVQFSLDRQDSKVICRTSVYRDGKAEEEYQIEYIFTGEEKEPEENIIKHYAKMSVYRCLSRFFKIEKAWGSLTGVRPTKMYRDIAKLHSQDTAEKRFLENYDVREDKLNLVKKICNIQKPILSSIDEKKDIDIYVGIPFCTSRCSYCSFFSSVNSKNGETEKLYVDTLIHELESLKELVADYRLRAIYMGGGTPTALSANLLDKVLDKVSEFGKPLEYTIEAGRPDTITAEKLLILKNHGVNRISVNPQTLCSSTLPVIGRKHSVDDFFKAYELAKTFSFDAVNMDLIAGLPKESGEDMLNSVRGIMQLDPENITIHTLAIKKGSKFGMENSGHFAESSVIENVLDESFKMLAENGYDPYYMYRQKYMTGNMENVGYSKPGKECIYNVDIMEEAVSILGIGSGTSSKRVDSEKKLIDRYVCLKDIKSYVTRIDEMIENKKKLFL